MRWKLIILLVLLIKAGVAISQDLVYAEYFLNTDPGYGNAIPISITPSPNIDSLHFNLSTAALTNGFHHLYVRVKDAQGKWSLTNVKPFLKETVYTSLPNLVYVEYFVDTDPGFGNATPIGISPGQDLDSISLIVDIAALPDGFHHLYIRARDANGKWSLTNVKPFLKETIYTSLPNLVAVEYFIDTDPGFGNATPIGISPGQDLDSISLIVGIAALPDGFHHLYIRAKDANGKWSLTNVKPFLKETVYTSLPNLVAVEYFVDTDPGYGNATPLSISPAQDLDSISLIMNIAALPDGFHHLFIRARDANGKWSLTNVKPFLKERVFAQCQNIVKVEYFFNNDPGFGNGIDVPINPGCDIDSLNIIADVSALPLGTHFMMLRVKDENGQWSQRSIKAFDVDCALMEVRFAADTGCSGNAVLFFDSSINVFPYASYHWDFGDGTPIVVAEKGDTSHVYGNAGVYEVSLEIHSRAECIQKDTILVSVQQTPLKPPKPQGQSDVGIGTVSTDYSTSGSSYALHYHWEISPSNAGSIVGNGLTATVIWDSLFVGNAQIRVKGLNDHCEGVFSEPLNVEVSYTAYRFVLQKQLCDGELSFTWRGQDYTQSGIYYDSLLTVNGGDSIYVLHLVISNDNTEPAVLNAKVLLQGAYTSNGLMRANIRNNGYLPMSQPYNIHPWYYAGTEALTTVPDSVVDWLLIELRRSPDTIVDRKAALLLQSGRIIDPVTHGGVVFDRMGGKSYYIAVHHRNHFPIMTASPECLPNAFLVDLSDTLVTLPYGGGKIATMGLGSGLRGMISGDINRNYQLKYSGAGNDRSLILQRIIQVTSSTSITATISGYHTEDITMDGIVKYSGIGNDAAGIIQNIVSLTRSTAITGVFNSIVPVGILAIPPKK